MEIYSSSFLVSVMQIIWINIILSGDNAIVIAITVKNLKNQHQNYAITIGSVIAISIRILFTFISHKLFEFPYIKIFGSVILIYISVSLIINKYNTIICNKSNYKKYSKNSLLKAILNILIIDLIMSLDNILAISAIALGDIKLLIIGIASSIPFIIFGSKLFLKLVKKFSIIIWFGSSLLGFISGKLFFDDEILLNFKNKIYEILSISNNQFSIVSGVLGLLFVLVISKIVLKIKDNK